MIIIKNIKYIHKKNICIKVDSFIEGKNNVFIINKENILFHRN